MTVLATDQGTEVSKTTRARRHRRTPQELIADLERVIAAIRARAARRQLKADPALRLTAAAVKSIDKALAATQDSATRQALTEARAILSACLALNGVTSRIGGVLMPVPRRPTVQRDDLEDGLLGYVRSHPGSAASRSRRRSA